MRNVSGAEPAVPLEESPEKYIALLEQIHAAAVSGESAPARPRGIVDRSWQRMRKNRMPVELPVPEVSTDPIDEAVDRLKDRQEINPDDLSRFLAKQLNPVLEGSRLLGILTTPDARVIQRFGPRGSLRWADSLGFVRGARWSENAVGTNAIGTAAVTRQAVQIHGPEHWCLVQQRWSCSAAPVIDPRTKEIVGILDISGPVAQAHPSLLGLVQSLAYQVELMLGQSHLRQLQRVRSQGLVSAARLDGPWVLTDRWGWVAAVSNLRVGARVGGGSLELTPGTSLVEGVGTVEVSRAGSGFLLQPVAVAKQAVYSLNYADSLLVVETGGTRNFYRLPPRHRDILVFLASSGESQTVGQIARQVWGQKAGEVMRVSTVRAEISRLRRRFPELISRAPYRLLEEVQLVGD